jgi:Ca2+-transporting ATPase
MLLEEGDRIPADGRLIHTAALQTAEAALTGESLPTLKDPAAVPEDVALGDRNNMVFSGTAVTSGHGTAVVTATGMKTEMGRIAGLLKSAPRELTPLQKELNRVGKRAWPRCHRDCRGHDRYHYPGGKGPWPCGLF